MRLIANSKGKFPNLAKVASKDMTRPVLAAIYYDVERAVLEATDSYKLVSIFVEVDDGDVTGLIPMEAFVAFYKAHKARRDAPTLVCRERDVELVENGSSARFAWDRPKGQFPKTQQLIPDDLNEFEVGVNAKLLYDLSQGFGSDVIVLQFVQGKDNKPNNLRPIVVKSNDRPDAIGLQMPIRIDN